MVPWLPFLTGLPQAGKIRGPSFSRTRDRPQGWDTSQMAREEGLGSTERDPFVFPPYFHKMQILNKLFIVWGEPRARGGGGGPSQERPPARSPNLRLVPPHPAFWELGFPSGQRKNPRRRGDSEGRRGPHPSCPAGALGPLPPRPVQPVRPSQVQGAVTSHPAPRPHGRAADPSRGIRDSLRGELVASAHPPPSLSTRDPPVGAARRDPSPVPLQPQEPGEGPSGSPDRGPREAGCRPDG